MNELPPWSAAAIARLQERMGTLAPEMAPLLDGTTVSDEAVARLLAERRPLLQASLRNLPRILAETDLEQFVPLGALSQLLTKGQEQFCLVVLLSPPQVSASCPNGLRHDLPLELIEELRAFIQESGSLYPVEFYGNLVQRPLTDSALTALQQALTPLPTLVLYSTLTDRKLYSHLAFWLHPQQSLLTCPLLPWIWEEALAHYEEQGYSERLAISRIRQQIVQTSQWILQVTIAWYYAHLYPLAPDLYRGWPAVLVPGFQQLLAGIDAQRHRLQRERQQEQLRAAQSRYAQLAPSARAGHLAQTLPTPRCLVYGLAFWPERDWLVVGGSAQFLQVLTLGQGRTVATLTGYQGDVLSLALEPTHQLLAASGSEGIVQVWNLKNLQLVHRFCHGPIPSAASASIARDVFWRGRRSIAASGFGTCGKGKYFGTGRPLPPGRSFLGAMTRGCGWLAKKGGWRAGGWTAAVGWWIRHPSGSSTAVPTVRPWPASIAMARVVCGMVKGERATAPAGCDPWWSDLLGV
ncbi:MAG: hypothetical protein HC918_07965 [Oscillatoriales cyanobacterium SM2_1_8]|nr:hypothetical protein [Oscillatoriales cyanobacterium SM2_1_8]